LYHWNTISYSKHKATDQFNDSLGEHIDKFLEVFIGRYNIKPQPPKIKLDSEYLTDEGFMKLMDISKIYLESLNMKIKDSELLSIRDELLVSVNQTVYLLRLN